MSKSLVCEGQVVRFLVENDPDGVTVTLAAHSKNPERFYHLRFTNVVDLRFENPVTFEANIVLLAESFASEGYEGIKFRLRDHERTFISFYCGAIEHIE